MLFQRQPTITTSYCFQQCFWSPTILCSPTPQTIFPPPKPPLHTSPPSTPPPPISAALLAQWGLVKVVTKEYGILSAFAAASPGSKRAVRLPIFTVVAPWLPLAAYELHQFSQAASSCLRQRVRCISCEVCLVRVANYEQ